MKILYVSSFDPAGVMASHREALRLAGHECNLVVDRAYETAPIRGDEGAIGVPDVLVVCPGIGTGMDEWPTTDGPPSFTLPKQAEELVDKAEKRGIPRVALFHGSVNTAAHVDEYARHFRERGFVPAATTLDYCTWMDAAYLPPFVNDGGLRAPLRENRQGAPFYLAHAPTNPDVCHTAEFFHFAVEVGAFTRFIHGHPHELCMKAKARCHAGFDHLRGAFSVNTLENAALGLVPLFGLTTANEERLRMECVDLPPIMLRSAEDLRHVMLLLAESPELTRQLQEEARAWYERNFNRQRIVDRLEQFYGAIQ